MIKQNCYLENLKYLNQHATPGPWKYGEFTFLVKHDDAALIVASRALLPELLSLWEAVDNAGQSADQDPLAFLRIGQALLSLNAKAAKVLK